MKRCLIRSVLYPGIGAVIGAALGYASQCSGGTCPLMCQWWRGAIVGAVVGLLIYFAGSATASKRNSDNQNPHLKDKP